MALSFWRLHTALTSLALPIYDDDIDIVLDSYKSNEKKSHWPLIEVP